MMPTVLNGVGAESNVGSGGGGGGGGEMSARGKKCTCGRGNAGDFTSCCADING